MPGTFGQRLRDARKAAGLTGPQLAKHMNVSAQTVSEWERGKYFPEAERLTALARFLHVKVDWLLGGTDGPVSGLAGAEGRLVSKIPFDELHTFDPLDPPKVTREKVFTHFPCGQHSFQFTINDRSNADDYLPGDSVIIDPDLAPTPGDMVLMIVGGAPLFRRYRPRGGSVELVPINSDWEVVTCDLGNGERMLGTMTERAQRRR